MTTLLRTTAALLLASTPFQLHAALADGYYDAAWIGGGRTTFYGDPEHTTYSAYVSAAIDESNGGLLLGGILIGNPAASWWVAELLPDGNFSTGFGIPYFHGSTDYGRVNGCQIGLSCNGSSYGFSAFARQADGRVLVLSASHLARTDEIGSSLDTTGVFGGNGYVPMPVSINTGSGSVSPLAMVLDSNGRALLAGTGYTGVADTAGKFGLVRMNADLSVDQTFNGNGSSWGTLVRVDGSDTAEYPTAMAVQPDGHVVVAGYGTNGGTTYFDIVRFKADGTPDGTFGNGGVAELSPPVAIQAGPSNIRVDALGRIVAALGNGSNIVVARVDATGQPDAAFGTSGYFVVSGNSIGCTNVAASAVAIDGAGRIVAGGSCDGEFLVERIRGDKGILDTSFGLSGYSHGAYSSNLTGNDVAQIGFDPGSRLLVTGSYVAGISQAGAARLTYDLIATSNFETAPRGCLPPDCQ